MTEDEVPSTHAPYLGYARGRAAAPGWSNYQLAVVLGVRADVISRWRNGLANPNVAQMKKLEAVLGWPASEQIDLLPLTGQDMRWSLVLNEVLKEWMIANPRDAPVQDLGVLVRVRKPGGGRKKKV